MQTNLIKTNSLIYEELKSQYVLTLKYNERQTHRDVTTSRIVEFCMHDKHAKDILSNNGFNKGEGIVASP